MPAVKLRRERPFRSVPQPPNAARMQPNWSFPSLGAPYASTPFGGVDAIRDFPLPETPGETILLSCWARNADCGAASVTQG